MSDMAKAWTAMARKISEASATVTKTAGVKVLASKVRRVEMTMQKAPV